MKQEQNREQNPIMAQPDKNEILHHEADKNMGECRKLLRELWRDIKGACEAGTYG